MHHKFYPFIIVIVFNMFWVPLLTQEDPDCPGAPLPRLIVGESGQVLPGDPNNLRDQPSRAGNRIGSVPGSATFIVLEGPVCADGFNWWRIDYDGQTGWTVEGSGTTYFVEHFEEAEIVPTNTPAPTATPAPTSTPIPAKDFVPPLPYDNQLAINARARIINDVDTDEPLILRMHTEPGISTPVTGTVQEETLVTIEDGPSEVDGLRWWLIRTDDGRSGWIIEGQRGERPNDLPYERTLLALCTATDGERVAYFGRQWRNEFHFNGYLYTMYMDGSSPCIFDRLKLSSLYTTWGIFNYIPWKLMPSPDGQQILYVDQPGGEFVLYAMQQDGTRQRLTANGNVYWADWTPDGSRLLFTMGDISTSNVWTQRPDGSARSALTQGAGSKSWAAWLADNESLVYVEQHGAAIQLHGPTETIIWTVSVQSGGLRELLRLTDDVRNMHVSPDGRFLFITGFTQELEPVINITGTHTLVLDISNSAIVFEDDNIYYSAFWSPDSRYLIYPLDGYPDEMSEEPIVFEFIPIAEDAEPLTVETDLHESFDMMRWLDDENLLILLSPNKLNVLNIRTGEVTAAADFTMP